MGRNARKKKKKIYFCGGDRTWSWIYSDWEADEASYSVEVGKRPNLCVENEGQPVDHICANEGNPYELKVEFYENLSKAYGNFPKQDIKINSSATQMRRSEMKTSSDLSLQRKASIPLPIIMACGLQLPLLLERWQQFILHMQEYPQTHLAMSAQK